MKALVHSLYANPKYAKVFEWCKLISITGGAQAIVQVTGLLCGILVIRLLPTEEYALYTLVNTMLGTMTVLADGGITTGVMAQGGMVWQNQKKLGAVITTGLNLRKNFAIGSLLVALPILFYLLLHHDASLTTSILIISSLIPAFYASVSDTLLEVVPKLRQQIVPLQRNQVEVSIFRLLLTGLTIFIFPLSYLAIVAGGLPRIWGNVRLRKISIKNADLTQKLDPYVEKEILAFVKRTLPGAIYYCVSGQIAIWLISIFGSTKAVAEIGALGRLAMITSFFSILFSTLISPRFARLPLNCILLKRYLQIHVGLLLLTLTIVTIGITFSSQLLKILGSNYENLQSELVLNIVSNCFSLIAGLSFSLYTSRGWNINPIISIPINVTSITLGIMLFDVSTVNGILTLNIFLSMIQAVINAAYGYNKILVATSTFKRNL